MHGGIRGEHGCCGSGRQAPGSVPARRWRADGLPMARGRTEGGSASTAPATAPLDVAPVIEQRQQAGVAHQRRPPAGRPAVQTRAEAPARWRLPCPARGEQSNSHGWRGSRRARAAVGAGNALLRFSTLPEKQEWDACAPVGDDVELPDPAYLAPRVRRARNSGRRCRARPDGQRRQLPFSSPQPSAMSSGHSSMRYSVWKDG